MTSVNNDSLFSNSRFYILFGSVLLSIGLAAYLRLLLPSDQLYSIRTQQLFGLLAIMYWYTALVISPLGALIGKKRIIRLSFARRAIGVSAAYFALLHSGVALWGQLGGFNELALLPDSFKLSLAAATVALLILLAMAATSFDKIVTLMTFTKWKWLHRLGYIGVVLIIIHIWTIGTHVVYPAVQWGAFASLVILAGLELHRITKALNQKYELFNTAEAMTFFVTCWAMLVVLIACIPVVIQSNHAQHNNHQQVSNDTSNHNTEHSE